MNDKQIEKWLKKQKEINEEHQQVERITKLLKEDRVSLRF